ncbi:hypothetical protein FSP39_012220 [Pinctada imbricata]|uniref:Uncharacterized protein n=1 Tax=Pinctada imbricata TaxID=66713 RepID=A0AA88Y4A0_PINIB|nr:hypothetical protein FSP39_012220 [Pinctada imbricata]
MATDLKEDDLNSLKHKIYTSARDGMAVSIFAHLWNMDKTIVSEVLNHRTEEHGQKTTPLIIAAKKGEDKVVSLLLTHFDVDIEQTGTVIIDGFTIEGATPLWCAAGSGHFSVVKILVEHSADVNHGSNSNSTPLRAACFDNRIDIVRYLVENHADITIPNKYDNTCLMISSYKGHKECVRFLLEKGADPNTTAHCGATALHFAAECGHMDVVKDLVNYGAVQKVNDHKMTPLLVASECGKCDIVKYFVSLPDCTKEEKVTAFELLGASFANDKENYDIIKAYQYLEAGMIERYNDPDNIIPKPYYPPVPAYNNHKESETLGELRAMKLSFSELHMESLAVRERILGADNPEVPHPVIFRGAVFADNADFDRCISLWMHAMDLRIKSKRTITKDILRFSQVFSQMLHLGISPSFQQIEEVIQYGLLELQNDIKVQGHCGEDHNSSAEIYQTNIHSCLYLFTLAAITSTSDRERENLLKLSYRFLRLKPELKNGYSPLHMAVDSATLVDNFHVNDVVTFPSAILTKLFIQSGANLNSQDKYGNTPLHVIARYNNPISDFDTLHQILLLLIQNDAHMDMCNMERKTPLQAATTGVAEVILRTNMKLSLKCLTAKAVKDYNLRYKGNVPVHLEEFLAFH